MDVDIRGIIIDSTSVTMSRVRFEVDMIMVVIRFDTCLNLLSKIKASMICWLGACSTLLRKIKPFMKTTVAKILISIH